MPQLSSTVKAKVTTHLSAFGVEEKGWVLIATAGSLPAPHAVPEGARAPPEGQLLRGAAIGHTCYLAPTCPTPDAPRTVWEA